MIKQTDVTKPLRLPTDLIKPNRNNLTIKHNDQLMSSVNHKVDENNIPCLPPTRYATTTIKRARRASQGHRASLCPQGN